MFRRLAYLVLVVTALLSVLGVGPTSTEAAVNIATVVLTIAVPFLPLAHINLSGPQMVGVSMIAALVISVAAMLITGDLKTSDLGGSAFALFTKFGLVWAGQQAVFQLFKDALPSLTTKPILAPAPTGPKPAA